MKASTVIALLTATLVSAQLREAPTFKEARAAYYRGADGDGKSYDLADRLFSQLYAAHPDDAEVKVYYGSLRLVEASRTWALWKKNSLSKQGIGLMDAAVSAAPENLEVRFVRAATTNELPTFFHRRAQSAQDFAWLAKQAAAAASKGALEPRLAAASLYHDGEFRQEAGRRDEAVAEWNQAISLAPDSRAARESRDALKKTGS